MASSEMVVWPEELNTGVINAEAWLNEMEATLKDEIKTSDQVIERMSDSSSGIDSGSDGTNSENDDTISHGSIDARASVSLSSIESSDLQKDVSMEASSEATESGIETPKIAQSAVDDTALVSMDDTNDATVNASNTMRDEEIASPIESSEPNDISTVALNDVNEKVIEPSEVEQSGVDALALVSTHNTNDTTLDASNAMHDTVLNASNTDTSSDDESVQRQTEVFKFKGNNQLF